MSIQISPVATKVISARVPSDIAEMIRKTCKVREITVSTFIQEAVTTPPPNTGIQSISRLELDNATETLSALLSAGGGLGAGLLVYKTLKIHLPNDGRLSDSEIEFLSLSAAIASGLLAAYGIGKLLSK